MDKKQHEAKDMRNCICILLMALTLISPAYATEEVIEQKVVILRGENSYLMEGDRLFTPLNKPYGYRDDRVLPYLLSAGWEIQNIFVNQLSSSTNLYGYALLIKRTRNFLSN
jgi:hypothetical protein